LVILVFSTISSLLDLVQVISCIWIHIQMVSVMKVL